MNGAGNLSGDLFSLMRARENFSIGHPSQIASSQARLTWRFFRDKLPKKKKVLFLTKFSKFTCNISLSLIYIWKEKTSEEGFLSSSLWNLV
jgi:hypothetical protein